MTCETIVIADAHFDGVNARLHQFLAFLTAASTAQHVILLGDMFNLWLGTAKFCLPQHRAVLDALQTLRQRGVRLTYIEGNRDYFLAQSYRDAPFHEIVAESFALAYGDRLVYFAHGDLVNVHDTPYRRWRQLSRNRLIFKVFHALPQGLALGLAQRLEQRLQGTNRRHKAGFPFKTCQDYAEAMWARGIDAIILGHFHTRYAWSKNVGGRNKTLSVLPAWKDTPTYLHLTAAGDISFRQINAA